ncbi:glutathione S-transferase [Roseococcus sp. SYP-B2431]|uniref:glutathione S-transferase family protein n=1 Tax=Roseococcus sp. SYP-B2431 TaxID=2496640 RepID=UPI00103889F0|nr:glutathione binding-like protein [Roseococcus sp. SYP-B2431]TCH99890.1 glutathione S-transferase [Roseococcus sp. SYP-B2431]
MKLFYAPGACSLGIHVLLEESGAAYKAELLNLREGAQFKPEFTSINPKSKVPTLQKDDGSVLTEFPAIAFWIAATNPAAKLMPATPDGQARALEATDYAVATIHMQGFSRMFRPANYAPSEADHEAVKDKGREMFLKGLAWLDKALEGKDYVAGEFSFGDAAPFYVTFWAKERMNLPLPPNVAAFYKRMLARPAVAKVMADEGLAVAA